MKDKKIFFQSSLPRAGSTLLQNIVGQNPDFYVTPTSGVLELLYSAREQYTQSAEFKAQDSGLMKAGWLGFCENGMQGFYKGITDKKFVLDKSRGWGIHYSFLNSFIKEPKVICMIRDPKAIFASMEKNFRKNPERSSGIVNWSTGQCTTVEKRIAYWSQNPPVGMAFERLKEMLSLGTYENMLFIRFEDLTEEPKKVMDDIYKYLELPEYAHDFDNVKQITEEDDSVYGVFGDHVIKPKVIPLKQDYEEILGKDICDGIELAYKWFYTAFN